MAPISVNTRALPPLASTAKMFGTPSCKVVNMMCSSVASKKGGLVYSGWNTWNWLSSSSEKSFPGSVPSAFRTHSSRRIFFPS